VKGVGDDNTVQLEEIPDKGIKLDVSTRQGESGSLANIFNASYGDFALSDIAHVKLTGSSNKVSLIDLVKSRSESVGHRSRCDALG
jgi:hypothetical protein